MQEQSCMKVPIPAGTPVRREMGRIAPRRCGGTRLRLSRRKTPMGPPRGAREMSLTPNAADPAVAIADIDASQLESIAADALPRRFAIDLRLSMRHAGTRD